MTKKVMADYVGSGEPPTGQTQAYQHACAIRGWNDPPKHVFSQPNASRNKIDLRKRVAHDLNSTPGVPSPSTTSVPPQPFAAAPNGCANGQMVKWSAPNTFTPPQLPTQPQPPQVSSVSQHQPAQIPNVPQPLSLQPQPITQQPQSLTNGYAAGGSCIPGPPVMNLPCVPMLSHATSTPNVNDSSQSQQIPPPSFSPLVHSSSVPYNLNMQQEPPSAYTQPRPVTQLTTSPPTHSPPNKSPQGPGRKIRAPAVNVGDDSIFSQLGTPTMLQSSHLTSKPIQPPNTTGNNTTLPATSKLLATPALNVIGDQPSSLPPILPSGVPADSSGLLYGRTNSLPPAPTQGNLPAPPVEGFYGRSMNSPLNSLGSMGSSPSSSAPSSPLPKNSIQNSPLENDLELLTQSVEKLLECKEKCGCVMTNKNSDDITKKVDLFRSAWSQGKLSNAVKVHMSNLTEALDKRDFGQADSIHRTLVRSHPIEVSSWQVGVKKLISSYQKVVEENNKY